MFFELLLTPEESLFLPKLALREESVFVLLCNNVFCFVFDFGKKIYHDGPGSLFFEALNRVPGVFVAKKQSWGSFGRAVFFLG
jgi:hypothetical protein